MVLIIGGNWKRTSASVASFFTRTILRQYLKNMKISELLNPIDNDISSLPSEISSKPIFAEPANYCSLCDRYFGRNSELKRHNRNSHPPEGAPWYPCPNSGCGKRFARMDALRDHLKTKRARMWNCQLPLLYYQEGKLPALTASTKDSPSSNQLQPSMNSSAWHIPFLILMHLIWFFVIWNLLLLNKYLHV